MHSHDSGRFIQPYGTSVSSPNLQSFSEDSIVFRNAFSASPTCSPSRAALLSGEYPHCNGMLGLAHRGFSMNYDHHLVRFLAGKGYHCALSGVQHEIEPVETRFGELGYHEYLGDRKVAHIRAAEFLEKPPGKPFFLSVGFFETHREFPEDHPLDDPALCILPHGIPDTPETREDFARFKASVRILDEKMGFVLDKLRDTGLIENTIVICTTDHGIAFPGMKCTLSDAGTGVMLMIRIPGSPKGGKMLDGLVSHIDVFPSICELICEKTPQWVRGKSIVPLIRCERNEINEEIFTEINFHAAYEPQRAVRTKQWKYVKRFDGRCSPVLPNIDDSLSKNILLENGLGELKMSEENLYDMILDPLEENNLAYDANFAEILADMRHRLESWMRDTSDPLLKGELEVPYGARLNNPDGLSPSEEPC